jgi:predicted phosphodiesterase
VHAKYAGDRLTPAFVSELPDTIFRGVDLWIHGHTHSPTDHYRGECRVVSNPRGYLQKDGSYENLHFDSKLVIEI